MLQNPCSYIWLSRARILFTVNAKDY